MSQTVPNLVDLDRCKSMLKIETDDYDADLNVLIASASDAVVSYLGRLTITLELDRDTGESEIVMDLSGSPTIIPERVTLATVMLVGTWYKSLDGNDAGDFDRGYLPKHVTSLLFSLRDPVLA